MRPSSCLLLRGLAFLTLLAAAPACSTPAPPPQARHLVLVTIDTLRADRLGAYGYPRAGTPRLDRIAREGAMAADATAHVPLTRPSHVNLFTGRLPYQTGIRDNVSPAVTPGTPLLAETLKDVGFATAAFVSSLVLDASSGLNRGFDTYAARFEGKSGDPQFLNSVQKKGDVTTGEAIAWLEDLLKPDAPPRRVFLWLHLYDPHDPYEPPEPYATRYAEQPYDGEVAWSDELVGRLDDAVARLGLRDESLLVVTSDHGEGLGEHGETLHGFFAYQTTLRIPFLARGPGIPGGTRLETTVRLVDVFPTVLDLLGVPAPAGAAFAGTNLAPVLRGEASTTEPATYAESLVPLLHFGWSDLRVLREGRWKYIHAPRPELYDLKTDPGETANLASTHASRAKAMREALGRFLEEERRAELERPETASASPTLLEKLGALGYVGGTAPAKTATPGADPKDRIEDFRFASDHIREGLLRFHDEAYAGSIERFRAVLSRGISSFELHFYMARSLFALGRVDEASRHYEKAVRWTPVHVPAWLGLAECRAAQGDPEAAIEALRRGIAALPRDASLLLAEARLLQQVGRREEARRAYELALLAAPANAAARVELGNLLRELGDSEEAVRHHREAVKLEPEVAYYWTSLGMTLGGKGRLAETEQAFREAWRLDAKVHYHAYNLGLILLRQGRTEEARPFFERALALEPGFAPARERLAELAQTAGKRR